MMKKGTYLSADELERADARRRFGYATVAEDPREIDKIVRGHVSAVVIDLDHVLLANIDAALKVASKAVRAGVPVGLHTFYPDDPRLAALASDPLVVVAKTHRQVRKALRRLRKPKAPRPTPYSPPVSQTSEVNHDHETVVETASCDHTHSAG